MKYFIIPIMLYGAIVACQGPSGDNGATGSKGLTGVAGTNGSNEVGAVSSYSSDSCVKLAGTAFYGIANSNSFSISSLASCHDPVEVLNETHSIFWLSQNQVASFREPHGIEVLTVTTE